MEYNTKVGEGRLGEEGWKRQSKGENGTFLYIYPEIN